MCSFVMVEFTELNIKIPSNQWLVNLDKRCGAKQAAPQAQTNSRRGGGITFPLLQ
jgi:hypothetical protein